MGSYNVKQMREWASQARSLIINNYSKGDAFTYREGIFDWLGSDVGICTWQWQMNRVRDGQTVIYRDGGPDHCEGRRHTMLRFDYQSDSGLGKVCLPAVCVEPKMPKTFESYEEFRWFKNSNPANVVSSHLCELSSSYRAGQKARVNFSTYGMAGNYHEGSWVQSMDETVGETVYVDNTGRDGAVYATTHNSWSWWYPVYTLQKEI